MDTKREVQVITRQEEQYPEKFRQLSDMPEKFWLMGELPPGNAPCLAIVGARNCSSYGENMAFEFARLLAGEGVCIISGLAAGVDGAAHRGALAGGGKTYGVLGCGVDICYPSGNRKIYEKMKKQGGILSEYEPGNPPLAYHFPKRNRLISAGRRGIGGGSERKKRIADYSGYCFRTGKDGFCPSRESGGSPERGVQSPDLSGGSASVETRDYSGGDELEKRGLFPRGKRKKVFRACK